MRSYHKYAERIRWRIGDGEWAALSSLLLTKIKDRRRGRPRIADDRQAAEACLFRYYHSLARNYRAFGWNQLPKTVGVSPATANRRFREWNESGAWAAFWDALRKRRSGRTRLQSVQSPVCALIEELERAYAFFNARCFDNALPVDILITVEPGRRFLGQFRADRNGRYWIAISTSVLNRGDEPPLHTLLHEMVHLRNHHLGIPDCHRGHHNRHFRDAAALVGLDCKQGRYGYAQTLPNERAARTFAKFRARDVFVWTWGKTTMATQ